MAFDDRRAAKSDATPSLERTVGVGGAVWMGLGSILGTGVFVSVGLAADLIGQGVVLAVALAAMVATFNGLSSAQLAAAHPVSGGTYEYGHEFVHPIAGFTAGWMFLIAKSASAATAALGCAGYLLHTLGNTDDFTIRIGVALIIVLVLTALVAGGLRRSNVVNLVIVTLTLSALMAFVIFGWLSVDAEHPVQHLASAGWEAARVSPSALLQATALMFVAYTGYGRIATLGEEVREPAQTIPRAIIATLGLSLILYVSVAATATAVVGPDAFAASTREVAAPLEVVARSFRHPGVAWWVAIGAITAMAGVLLNLLLGLSRVLLAMARRGELPTWFGRIDASTHSPERAVWTMGAVTGALVLLGDLRATWSLSALTVLVYYGLTNVAALALDEKRRRFPRWIAGAGVVSCFGLVFFIQWQVWIAGLTLLAIGLLLRGWVRSSRGM